MNRRFLIAAAIAAGVAGCESGDINIQPTTKVTGSNNTVVNNPSGNPNSEIGRAHV